MTSFVRLARKLNSLGPNPKMERREVTIELDQRIWAVLDFLMPRKRSKHLDSASFLGLILTEGTRSILRPKFELKMFEVMLGELDRADLVGSLEILEGL